MRLCRAREEVDIVAAEMATISTSETVLLDLESKLTVREQSRCRDKAATCTSLALIILKAEKNA